MRTRAVRMLRHSYVIKGHVYVLLCLYLYSITVCAIIGVKQQQQQHSNSSSVKSGRIVSN